jgi:hypothetical protein
MCLLDINVSRQTIYVMCGNITEPVPTTLWIKSNIHVFCNLLCMSVLCIFISFITTNSFINKQLKARVYQCNQFFL